MRSYRSSLAVDRRAGAIGLDASAAQCVPQWTTAWPSLGDRENVWWAGWGWEKF